jgi:uncharacterized membrane protein
VSTNPSGGAASDAAYALEAAIGRLLVAGTWLAMGLVAVGVVLMLATGVDPLPNPPRPVPPFSLASVAADLAAFKPAGFLWAGILLVIALPIGRVVVAGVGFIAARDWRLAVISGLVLLVVLISIGAALGLEG